MKIFVAILNCYLLFLSFIPCNDKNIHDTNTTYTITTTTQHQNTPLHEGDICSPFCMCACCMSFWDYQHTTIVTTSKPDFELSKHVLINEFFISQEFSSIWQPPKIA